MSEVGLNLESKIALATNHLAVAIYKSLPEEQNIFLSPLSIAIAFGMLHKGARTSTAEEMKDILGYDRSSLSEDQVSQGFKHILYGLLKEEKTYTLDVANKALKAEGTATLDSYRNTLVEYYQAEIEEVNFVEDGLAIMNRINTWVSGKTKGMIQNLISTPPDAATSLILLNAVYFKGTWKSKFDEDVTTLKPFYNSGVRSKDVQMMQMELDTRYTYNHDLDCQLLELPYLGEELSMVIILPNEKTGLSDLEKKLTWEVLDNCINDMFDARDVSVMLPRFKFEKEYDLKEVMQSIGLQKVFDRREADLSGISGTANLYVSKAVHKAVVEVNEEGSEAAAVTAIFVQFLSSCSIPQRNQRKFHADHPFVFAIREKSTGLFLFIGRVNDL